MNAQDSTAAPSRRIASVDIVRGAIMVIMALDHVRDFTTNTRIRPEDLAHSSVALFATRWITHFCAPAFFMLAGVGIGILFNRGKSPAELSRFLLKRGLWLLVLELIITPLEWRLSFHLLPAFALVLWALGWAMILMALLVHIPRRVIAVLSLVMIFGHNLLDGIQPASFGSMAGVWNVLHVPGFVIPNVLFVAYPLIPWVAVMALGYVLAAVYQWEPARRRRTLILCGAVSIAIFVALRTINMYGDPGPWSAQRTTGLTIASFLNVLKYPPSLDFLSMTLGPSLIALALTEGARGRFAVMLAVYGRVPLFFYVTHIMVAHIYAVALGFVQGHVIRAIPVITNPGAIPAWYGLPLPGVYAMWMLVVITLYLPCRKFSRMKNTRTDWWLSYL